MSATKIFIGSIPPNVTEDQVQAEARRFGEIDSHYYKPDANNKGWAFITYKSADEAQNAITQIHQKLTFPGTASAVEARIANAKNNRKRERQLPTGWAMYTDPQGKVYYHHADTQRTQWEYPEDETAGRTNEHRHDHNNAGAKSQFGPVNANLFVFHIPNDWSDQELYNQFVTFGEILSARIQKDHTGRNKGFGFVSYTTAEAATAAISKMDGFHVAGKWLKVQHKKGEGNGNNNSGKQFNNYRQNNQQQQQQQQQQNPGFNPQGAAPFQPTMATGAPHGIPAMPHMMPAGYPGYQPTYYPYPGQGFPPNPQAPYPLLPVFPHAPVPPPGGVAPVPAAAPVAEKKDEKK